MTTIAISCLCLNHSQSKLELVPKSNSRMTEHVKCTILQNKLGKIYLRPTYLWTLARPGQVPLKSFDFIDFLACCVISLYFYNDWTFIFNKGWYGCYRGMMCLALYVRTICSPIMTWRLIINYGSSADRLGFFLTISYNLNQPIAINLLSA